MTNTTHASDLTFIKANGRSIPVRTCGTGTPILFLHGYPLDSRLWQSVMPLLADFYRCIAPDLRGFGQSSEERMSFTMADLACDMAKLLETMGIDEPVMVCGLSMGGYVAMELVENYPQLVSKVVLTNTRCNADDEAGAAQRRLAGCTALRDGVAAAVSPMLEKLISKETMSQSPSVVATLRSMMFETRASTIAWAQIAMSHRRNFGPLMRGWRLPSLCIGGQSDPIAPPKAIEEMATAIPNSVAKFVSNSAHLTPLECPAEFAELLRAFEQQTSA